MFLIDVEREMSCADLVAISVVCILAGIVVWWDSWCVGLMVWVYGSICWAFAVEIVLSLRLPSGVREAISIAKAEFQQRYPTDHITSVAVRAVQAERFVISIRYDRADGLTATPPLRRYFGVARTPPHVVEELPKRDWWPRGLK